MYRFRASSHYSQTFQLITVLLDTTINSTKLFIAGETRHVLIFISTDEPSVSWAAGEKCRTYQGLPPKIIRGRDPQIKKIGYDTAVISRTVLVTRYTYTTHSIPRHRAREEKREKKISHAHL